jgi:hypothetical protein
MAYIGPEPAESFTSFATQEFSTSATTSYTLDHAVANENEIALFVNNVRQQPGSGKAYTATGTALTLSAATASTDTMYCVFLGRALQTVTPATNSITAAMIGDTAISGKDALTAIPADTDELIISDAGTLKRIDYSLLRAGTPSFRAYASSTTNVDNNTATQISLQTEDWDTDSAFASSTFTVPSGKDGKYVIIGSIRADASWAETEQFNAMIYRNGASNTGAYVSNGINASHGNSSHVSAVIDLAAGDTIKLYLYHDEGGTEGIQTGQESTFLSGVRIG